MSADPVSEHTAKQATLGEFLHTHVADKKNGKAATFTGMGSQKGNWCVDDSEYETFLDKLHDHLFVSRKQPFGFVERPIGNGRIPVLIDLDLHFDSDSSLDHNFKNDQIKRFLEAYGRVLTTYFEMPKATRALRFFVTLRPQGYRDNKKDIIKDGIHIQCPDITVFDKHQLFIRSKLMEESIIDANFGSLGFVNSADDVYDSKIYANGGWFFYGESKPNTGAYKLELIYKLDMKSGKWSEEPATKYTTRTLVELLSIRYKISEAAAIGKDHVEAVEEWCGRVAGGPKGSAGTGQILTSEDQDLIVAQSLSQIKKTVDGVAQIFNSQMSTHEYEYISRLTLECLSEERASDFNNWMRVGWCLRNIDPSDEMFELWMAFSRKSPKFSEGDIGKYKRQWLKGSMKTLDGAGALKLGSLYKWARDDNPEKYKEIIEANLHNKIQKIARISKGGTHYHLADIVHDMYGDIYRCHVENRSTEWYEFANNTWALIPQAVDIKKKLSTDVAAQISVARTKLRIPGNEDQEMKDKQLLLDLERSLYNNGTKENIIREAVQLFMDKDFHKKMNADPYKIGCANGILHLRTIVYDDAGKEVGYKAELRQGTPEDYVSFQAGVCNINNVSLEAIPYEPYDPEDPQIEEIMEFFAMIFPNEELREFVLTLAAGCLEGNNIEQSFYIMTGSGSNGKSKFVNLLKYTLGDYASSLSTTTITRKRPDAGAANPDLVTIKNRRFIDMAEPDEREQLNTAIIKQLSGGDNVMVRGLYKEQEQIKVSGKMFLATNRMPRIESMDGGTWRRIKVIPFLSKFLDPGHPSIDPANNYYVKDYMLEEKLQRWRVSFFSLLVHYYETKYCVNGGIRKFPNMVDEYTNEYKGNNDTFEKFMQDRIRTVTSKDKRASGSSATLKDIQAVFRSWAESNSTKKLSEAELKERLCELLGKPADAKKNIFMHIKLFRSDEELEEWELDAD